MLNLGMHLVTAFYQNVISSCCFRIYKDSSLTDVKEWGGGFFTNDVMPKEQLTEYLTQDCVKSVLINFGEKQTSEGLKEWQA